MYLRVETHDQTQRSVNQPTSREQLRKPGSQGRGECQGIFDQNTTEDESSLLRVL